MLKNRVFLRVRMTDCDAGALGNPRNLGGDGWEPPDAKNVVFTLLYCTFDKKPSNYYGNWKLTMLNCDTVERDFEKS